MGPDSSGRGDAVRYRTVYQLAIAFAWQNLGDFERFLSEREVHPDHAHLLADLVRSHGPATPEEPRRR